MAKPKSRKTVRKSVKRALPPPAAPKLYTVWDDNDGLSIGEDVIGRNLLSKAEVVEAIQEYVAQNDTGDDDWQRRIKVYEVQQVAVHIGTETKAEVSWP